MTLAKRLEKLEALEKAATPGPWERTHKSIWHVDIGKHIIYFEQHGNIDPDTVDYNLEGDMEFIAASRNEMKFLIETIRKMKEALESISEYGNWGNRAVISNEAVAEARKCLAEIEEFNREVK
jgi:hypothetical protein